MPVWDPRLQESQILQNSSEILVNFAFLTRIVSFFAYRSFFAAVQFFEAGNAKKFVGFMHFL